MIGISEIANKICNNYPILAREYLGIDISTNNIMEINDFVKAYSSNKFVSAIDKPFLFRNEEMLEIENAFKETWYRYFEWFCRMRKNTLSVTLY